MKDILHGCPNKDGLIEQELQIELRRQRRLNARHRLPYPSHDIEGRRAGALQDRHKRGAPTILSDHIGLHRKAIAHLRDVTDIDHGAVHLPDRKVVEGCHNLGTAVQSHAVFPRADLRAAGRQDQVLRIHGVRHIGRGQAFGEQRLLVEIHHDLPGLAAVGQRHLSALDGGQLRADKIEAVIVELRFGERRAAGGDLNDRHIACAVLHDQRRLNAGRQHAQDGLRDGGHLRDSRRNVRVGMKEDFDHADAEHGLRFHMLDVVDRRGHRALAVRDDAPFHFLGGHAVVLPDHAHDRDVNLRQNVGGHPKDRHDPQDRNQNRHDDERVGVTERDSNEPYHGAAL